MKLLLKNWKNKFIELIKSLKNEVTIISPFISKNSIDLLYNNLPNTHIKIKILTKCNDLDFFKEVSSPEALEKLLNNNAEVRILKYLHAKVYLFDNNSLIITSANFTSGGINFNYEIGVLIIKDKSNSDLFNSIHNFYEQVNKKLTLQDIKKVKNRIKEAEKQIDKNYFDTDNFNFKDLGFTFPNANDDEIRLKENINIEKIKKLISEVKHTFFIRKKQQLEIELNNSHYKYISVQNYIWLCGWSNTGCGCKNAMNIVSKLCYEMFGYYLPLMIKYNGANYNLKNYRWRKTKFINVAIIEYHENKLTMK